MTQRKKLSTDAYKGVRDFYPEDMAVEKYIFDTMRSVAERYGYEEYTASLIEPTELYRAKTGDEIVNEQTYSFTDRGGRDVTLRPEMTPTAARMVAARHRDLSFPLRWYSIPNVFRYERPQRGRLREHWQLNVDIFGVEGVGADIEIMAIAYDVMKAFGATQDDFSIHVNSRKLLQEFLSENLEDQNATKDAMRLIDRSAKDNKAKSDLQTLLGGKELSELRPNKALEQVFEQLAGFGIKNAIFDPGIVRGFDYYTDIVFEVFDTNPENNRSIFGGGRYDGLTDIFGVPNIAAVGFGMGDVTIRDFLEIRNLIPKYKSPAKLYICTTAPEYIDDAQKLARTLRGSGVSVAIDLSNKRIGDQVATANKKSIPFVVCLGEQERATNTVTLKELSTGTEQELPIKDLTTHLGNNA